MTNIEPITIKSAILDLVRNSASTGFFDKIKITATDKQVYIEALERDKEVVFKGTLPRPIESLQGEFGLSNLALLGHIVGDPDFNHADSKLDVIYQTISNQKVPVELGYKNRSGSQIIYRFMNNQLIPPQPKFVEPAWDVTISPSKASVQQFAWAATGLSGYEQYFIPKVVDKELKFFIGAETSANQRGAVSFATGVEGKLTSDYRWKIANILGILKLVDSTECKMSFSQQGVIQITMNTGVGEYKFICLAKAQ